MNAATAPLLSVPPRLRPFLSHCLSLPTPELERVMAALGHLAAGERVDAARAEILSVLRAKS